MLRELDFRDVGQVVADQLPRAQLDIHSAVAVVEPICRDVARRGEAAIREYSERFDAVTPEQLRVPGATLQRAAEQLDPELKAIFTESIRRRREVAQQLETTQPQPAVQLAPGASVGLRSVPMERVGLYVPGGLAPLASSVIMNVVPAQVAGVPSIAVASPPQAERQGLPHPTILALCHLLGVEEVYAVGGAQAVAMFAYGVPGLCDPVSLITGPGNVYVAAAKRVVRGVVGIDSEAGPTEIAILADATATPAFVAADLISQAEHDPLAASVLITDSRELAAAVNAELEKQLGALGTAERIRTSLGGEQSAVVLVRDLDQGIAVANAYGAEHLEIHTADAHQVAQQITSAGAIFVGAYSPVSLGDYSAGSTHVLPTAGTSAFSSGLTVHSFMRHMHVIDYSQQALEEIGDGVERFAVAEDLPGHAHAVRVRR